jgi:hypothetical protein
MKYEINIAPENSLIFVMDHSVGEVPESMNKQSISYTDTCVAIGTLSASDGETNLILTDEIYNLSEDLSLRFDK